MQLLKTENSMLKMFKVDQSLFLKNQKCKSVKKSCIFAKINGFPILKNEDHKYDTKKPFIEREKNLCFDHRAIMVTKLVSHLIGKHAILRSRRPPITLKNLTLFSSAVRELFKCSASCRNLISHALST